MSWSIDSLACRDRCGRREGLLFSVLVEGKYPFVFGGWIRGDCPRGYLERNQLVTVISFESVEGNLLIKISSNERW